MDIDGMVDELLGMDIVKDEDTVVFLGDARQLIHKNAPCGEDSENEEGKDWINLYCRST